MTSLKSLMIIFGTSFLACVLIGVSASLHVRKAYAGVISALVVLVGSLVTFYTDDGRLSVVALIFAGFMALFLGAGAYLIVGRAENLRRGKNK